MVIAPPTFGTPFDVERSIGSSAVVCPGLEALFTAAFATAATISPRAEAS
jgi:hypothetical protein